MFLIGFGINYRRPAATAMKPVAAALGKFHIAANLPLQLSTMHSQYTIILVKRL